MERPDPQDDRPSAAFVPDEGQLFLIQTPDGVWVIAFPPTSEEVEDE